MSNTNTKTPSFEEDQRDKRILKARKTRENSIKERDLEIRVLFEKAGDNQHLLRNAINAEAELEAKLAAYDGQCGYPSEEDLTEDDWSNDEERPIKPLSTPPRENLPRKPPSSPKKPKLAENDKFNFWYRKISRERDRAGLIRAQNYRDGRKGIKSMFDEARASNNIFEWKNAIHAEIDFEEIEDIRDRDVCGDDL